MTSEVLVVPTIAGSSAPRLAVPTLSEPAWVTTAGLRRLIADAKRRDLNRVPVLDEANPPHSRGGHVLLPILMHDLPWADPHIRCFLYVVLADRSCLESMIDVDAKTYLGLERCPADFYEHP